VLSDEESNQEPWSTCPRFYPRNEDVDSENEEMLYRNFDESDIFNASASYYDEHGSLLTFEDAKKITHQSLRSLHLAVDAPVMINDNDDKDFGIVNGTPATVAGYISSDGTEVDYILLNVSPRSSTIPLPDLTIDHGNNILETYHNVWPLSRSNKGYRQFEYFTIEKDGVKSRASIHKKEFSLDLAYAMTIHKAEGKTCKNVIVDIHKPFQGTMTYVALSRCESLDGLRLKQLATMSDLNVSKHLKYRDELDNEFDRLRDLQARLIATFTPEIQAEDDDIAQRLMIEDAELERLYG
jgi:hypothetical protein